MKSLLRTFFFFYYFHSVRKQGNCTASKSTVHTVRLKNCGGKSIEWVNMDSKPALSVSGWWRCRSLAEKLGHVFDSLRPGHFCKQKCFASFLEGRVVLCLPYCLFPGRWKMYCIGQQCVTYVKLSCQVSFLRENAFPTTYHLCGTMS